MNLRAAFQSAGGDPDIARAYVLIVDYLRDTSHAAQSVKGLTAKLRKHSISFETITAVAMEVTRSDLTGRPGGQKCIGDDVAHGASAAGPPQGEARDQYRHGSDAQIPIVAPSPFERPDDRKTGASESGAHCPIVVGSPKGEEADHSINDAECVQGEFVPSSSIECPRDLTASVASSDQKKSVSGAPQSRAGDQTKSAPSAGQPISVAARPPIPVQPQGPSDAYLRALAESQRATAKIQLELIKTSTGHPWGSIKPRELAGMERDGRIGRAIREAYGPFSERQMGMEFREFLPDAIFKKALSIAEVKHVG